MREGGVVTAGTQVARREASGQGQHGPLAWISQVTGRAEGQGEPTTQEALQKQLFQVCNYLYVSSPEQDQFRQTWKFFWLQNPVVSDWEKSRWGRGFGVTFILCDSRKSSLRYYNARVMSLILASPVAGTKRSWINVCGRNKGKRGRKADEKERRREDGRETDQEITWHGLWAAAGWAVLATRAASGYPSAASFSITLSSDHLRGFPALFWPSLNLLVRPPWKGTATATPS